MHTKEKRAHAPLPGFDRAHKAAWLQGNLAMRSIGNAVASAQLFMLRPDPALFGEFVELQQAGWKRFTAMQSTWLQNWAEWMTEADHIARADTLSILFEQETIAMVQFVQLLTSQATDMIRLGETMDVSHRYWLSEKLART